MKIQVLEFGQLPTEAAKHSITNGKAKRLVHELGWAVEVSKRVILITIRKTWAAIKACLAGRQEQVDRAAAAEDYWAAWRQQNEARTVFPSGAEFTFSRWPCADQRSFGIA